MKICKVVEGHNKTELQICYKCNDGAVKLAPHCSRKCTASLRVHT
jgi:hypothetical protein